MKFDSCVSFHDTNSQVDWQDVISKLKPGAHVLAICPMLHHHKVTAALEDSGVEIRDSILYLNSPAYMITLGRVPLDGTVAQNILRHGTGGLNIDRCRIEFKSEREKIKHSLEWDGEWKSRIIHYWDDQIGNHPGPKMEKGDGANVVSGRWPSNVIISSTSEIKEKFPNSKSCNSPSLAKPESKYRPGQGNYQPQGKIYPGEDGSASRFYYSVSLESPLRDLVEYLAKLVTKSNGKILTIGLPRNAINSLEKLDFAVTSYE